MLLIKKLLVGFLSVSNGFNPVFNNLGSMITNRLNGNVKVIYENDNLNSTEQACILFFTGLNGIIPGEIYNDFFKALSKNNISTYVAEPSLEENYNLLDDLIEKYSNVTVVGHSSGSVNAIMACNSNRHVKSAILMDPVDNSKLVKEVKEKLTLKYVEDLLFLNAAKSYEWKINPTEFKVPFIPSFRIENENLELKKGHSITIEASEFGHSDVLDNVWADFMDKSISEGSQDRSEETLLKYKEWLANTIKNFITKEDIEEVIKKPEEYVEDAVLEISNFTKEVSDNFKLKLAKIIKSRREHKQKDTEILYRKP
tara:strand:+ start:986 stop:1924 length:939 start_codon:yes stop_codon:yes gene_type:complete